MTHTPSAPGSHPGYRPGYEVVAERILELLVVEGLRPGDYIGTETELAKRLGVSRTVTREAVKILTAIGRVRSRRGKGLYVATQDAGFGADADFFLPADLDHVFMLFEFRRVQEEAAARLAAVRATPPDVRAIRQAAEDNRMAAKAGDLEEFDRTDDAFHHALAKASHNQFLTSAVHLARRLQRQAGLLGLRATMAGSPEQAAEEHLRIAEAVATGDPERAAQAVDDHLDSTREHYQQRIREFVRLDQARGSANP